MPETPYTDAQLEQMTADQLVEIYNARATVRVKKFRDKKSGIQRVKELYPGDGSATSPTASGGVANTMPPAESAGAEETMGDAKAEKAEKAEKKGKGKSDAEKAETKAKREAAVLNCAPDKAIKAPRENSKRDKVIKLLKKGAKLEDIQKEMGWTRANTMDCLRLLHSQHGYGFETNSAGTIKILGA